MQPHDYDEFTTLLNATAELLAPNRPMSSMAIRMWWSILQPYDLAAVRQALDRHMRNPDTGQFMPKPADVIRMMQGSTQDSAMVAWSKVDKGIRQVGTYASVVFDDPVIHRVIHDMGGWVALGTKTEHEWPFVAKEFENRYRGYRVRSETPEYPATLIGIAEAQNSQDGRQSQAPVLIGNSDKAKRVLLGGAESVQVGFERMSTEGMLALAAPKREAA